MRLLVLSGNEILRFASAYLFINFFMIGRFFAYWAPFFLCCTWDQKDETQWDDNRNRYRRLCPEIEALSMRQYDQRNILPYFQQSQELLASLFRSKSKSSSSSQRGPVIFVPRDPTITLCINGAPGFVEPSRNVNVHPVIYGPTLKSFHRDFVLAVGEYYSTYIFLFGIYLQEKNPIESHASKADPRRCEFHVPCPSGPEMFSWYYSDALTPSLDSRADDHVYHDYQQAIFSHSRGGRRTAQSSKTIWHVFIEKAPEIFLQARRTAMDMLQRRGRWGAVEQLKHVSFCFVDKQGECCCDRMSPCDINQNLHESNFKFPMTFENFDPKKEKDSIYSHVSPRANEKQYHDKSEDSEASDEDAVLSQRYKMCRYRTKKGDIPSHGPCITHREREEHVPVGICWGHWQKYCKHAQMDAEREFRDEPKDHSGSQFCNVM